MEVGVRVALSESCLNVAREEGGVGVKMMGGGAAATTLEGIAGLLAGTLSGDRATREGSQGRLEALRAADPGLAVALLAVVQGAGAEAAGAAQAQGHAQADPASRAQAAGVAAAGATYLKNMVKAGWKELPDANLGIQLRAALLDVLATCPSEAAVRPLLEAFRIVASTDFCERGAWPELVDWLVAAVHRSDLMGGGGETGAAAGPVVSTLRVLRIVHAALLPFQFGAPGRDAGGQCPEELEALVARLLVPCRPVFSAVVAEGPGAGANPEAREELLHIVTKSFYRATRKYMPPAILGTLGLWAQDLLALLRQAADFHVQDDAQIARAKTVKRVLKVVQSLTTVHRKHAEAIYQPAAEATVAVLLAGARRRRASLLLKADPLSGAGASAGDVEDEGEGEGEGEDEDEDDAHVMANAKIQCTAFELVARMLQGGTGYRLFKDHLGMLVSDAVFPQLQLSKADLRLWEEDEEEYVRSNLWSDLADDAGPADLASDESTARAGALSLMRAIAQAREGASSGAAAARKGGGRKRGKGGAGAGAKDKFSAGEQIVVKFLAGFPCPGPHVADPAAREEALGNYYGVIFGYVSAQPFLASLPPADQAKVLKDRIFPVFDAAAQGVAAHEAGAVGEREAQKWVLLLASACWAVGEFAAPGWNERLSAAAYGHLMRALGASDSCGLSWKPVRASAAGALKALLEAGCAPPDVGALFACILAALVARGESGDMYEVGTLLYLFATAIEHGGESVVAHAPEIASTVAGLAYTASLPGMMPATPSKSCLHASRPSRAWPLSASSSLRSSSTATAASTRSTRRWPRPWRSSWGVSSAAPPSTRACSTRSRRCFPSCGEPAPRDQWASTPA